jgi:hypothetical protein
LLEARDDKGNTALLSAFLDNVNSNIVLDKAEAMLEAGANPTVCDALGETVLMKAMRYERDYYSNKFISKVIKSILSRTHPVSHTPHVHRYPYRSWSWCIFIARKMCPWRMQNNVARVNEAVYELCFAAEDHEGT